MPDSPYDYGSIFDSVFNTDPQPSLADPYDYGSIFDSVFGSGESQDGDWVTQGIFEVNKTTGETRLKDKPGQLGGIGGTAQADLEKHISIPDNAEAPDLNISYKDSGILPGLGLPGLLFPKAVESLPGGEYIGQLGAAATAGAMMAPEMATSAAGAILRTNEWAVKEGLKLLDAPEEALTNVEETYAPVNAGLSTVNDWIGAGRQLVLEPGSSGYASDAVDSLKDLWKDPTFANAASFAKDVPLAVAEQVAQMEAGFFAGGALKGASGAATGAKLIASNIGAGYGAQIGTNTYNELYDAGISPLIAGPVAAASGFTQSWLETWGAMEMLGGKVIGEKVLSKMNAGLVSRTLVRAFTSAMTEGGEEAAQQVVDNIAKQLPPNWDKLPEKSLTDLLKAAGNGAWDSFLGGAIIGGPLGGITGLAGVEAEVKPTPTPETVPGVANGGVVTLDQPTKDFIAGETPGQVLAAGELGNRIAEDTVARDDGDLPSLLDNINKEILLAQEDPNTVTRNRTAKAISDRIDETLKLIEAGEANGLPAEQMASLFDALDSMSSFSKARAKWAEGVRKRLFDAVESQARANAPQITEEQADSLGKALQTTVQKTGESTKQQVMQVGQEITTTLQALQPIDVAAAQAQGMDPAQLEQLQGMDEDKRALAQQALDGFKRRLTDGDLAWIGLDSYLIENLDKVDWEYVADSAARGATDAIGENIEPIVSAVSAESPTSNGSILSKIAQKLSSIKQATTEMIVSTFPYIGESDVVGEVRRVFTEMASGHVPDSKFAYLAALSHTFGFQDFAPTPENLAALQGQSANQILDGIKQRLSQKGFGSETIENAAPELQWMARTLADASRIGSATANHKSAFVQSSTRSAATLLTFEPEAVAPYSQEIAQQYAEKVFDTLRKGSALRVVEEALFTGNAQLQKPQDESDILALGTLALDRLLSDGSRGVDALVAMGRVGAAHEIQDATQFAKYVYKRITGRDAITNDVAMAVARNVISGLSLVPGPHSLIQSLRGHDPRVQVSVIAAVDAMADVWSRANNKPKSKFYSRLADSIHNIEVPSSDVGHAGYHTSTGRNESDIKKAKTRRIAGGIYSNFGTSMIAIFSESRDRQPYVIMHEVIHALDFSGLLSEMATNLYDSGVSDVRGITSDVEKLTVGFGVFLSTRAAPNKKLAPLFTSMKRYLSEYTKTLMTMTPSALSEMEKYSEYGAGFSPESINFDMVRGFYTMLNAGDVSAEALAALGPTNFAVATVEEAMQQASDGKRSILPTFTARAEQIQEDVQNLIGDRDESVIYGAEAKDDSPNNQVGDAKNLVSPDIKEHVENLQKEYEATNPMFTVVDKKKKEAKSKRPTRTKRKAGGRKRTRLKKPSVKKAQAVIDKLANMEDAGRFTGEESSVVKAGVEALDMIDDLFIQSDKEVDTKRSMTWKNFPDVMGEKIVNWFRMMTTRFHSKDSRGQRVFDETGRAKAAQNLQNLAGLANRASKVTKLPVTVFDNEANQDVPVRTETKPLDEIVDNLQEAIRPFSEISKIPMENIFKHFIIYLSANRQNEVFQNGIARLQAWQQAMDKWEKGDKKGAQPEKPDIVLSPEFQTAAEQSLKLLRMVYGDENLKIFDTYAEQITRWGRAAILDKLLHVGLISQAEYDSMVKAGKRWIPFTRLTEFIDNEHIPYEFRSDGSVMDPVKFLTMDISGGIRNPITELARRAAAVDMLTAKQAVRNHLGEMVSSMPNSHKLEGGMRVIHKRVVVSKAVWDATPEDIRVKEPRSVKLSDEERARVAGSDPSITSKRVYEIYVPITKADYGKMQLKGKINGYVVAAWKNGVPTYIQITDKDLAQAYIEMTPVQSNVWHKFLSGGAFLTRQFVGRPLVTTVSFMWNGPWRDLFSAFSRSQHGMLPLIDFGLGLYQSLGVLFPTLSELYPTHFAAAKAYNEGRGGMSTMQAQMHEVAYGELAHIFRHGKRIRQPKTVTGGPGTHAKAIFNAVLGDMTDRLYERGVFRSTGNQIIDTKDTQGFKNKLVKAGEDLKRASGKAKLRRAGETIMVPWNGFLFLPELVTEAMELSYRLGEGRLTMAEAIQDPRLVGYYQARNANFKKGDRVGYTGVINRLKWLKNKNQIIKSLNEDPYYVPPEDSMPVYITGGERDNAIRNITLDFGSRGRYASTSGAPAAFDGQALSKMYVFWNPMMQDAYSSMKMMRPAMEWMYWKASAGVSKMLSGVEIPQPEIPTHLVKKGLAFMTKMFVGTTIPFLAQLLMFKDDDDWWSKSYLERVAYIHFPWKNDKGQFFKIPAGLSFATLIFRDLPMSAMMQAAEKDPQAVSKFLDRFFDQMPFGLPFRSAKVFHDKDAITAGKQLAYDLAPSFAIQPAISAAMNYNGFFGSEIVRPEMYEETLATERDADRFGYVQNKLARWMKIEPQMADYIIRRGFPGAVNLPIAPVNVANYVAKQANVGGEEMGAHVGTAMSYGGNMTPWLSKEQWGASNEWVRDFNKLYRETQKARNSYDTYVEDGNEKRANELYREYPMIQDQNWARLEYVNDTIRDFWEIRKEITGNQSIPQDEKDALVLVHADMPMSLFAMEEMRAILNYASEVK